MKTTNLKFKKQLLIATSFALSFACVTNFTFAEENTKQVKTQEIKEVLVKDKDLEKATTTKKQIKLAEIRKNREENKDYKNVCEISEGIAENVESLSLSSKETKSKLKSIEKTIDEESLKRESIISNIKNIFSLKKTDKQVLTDMKKVINKAYAYYLDLDETVLENQVFLEENDCNKLEVEILIEKIDELEYAKLDEAEYRKYVTQTLKEKIKIISKEIEKTNTKK